ncbi:MAG TPA: hypothetical protein VG944_21345 [Fimbriimonas sp.]|nr:hypothetical protein [Fimbriimonas sp.]
MITPTESERERQREVFSRVLQYIREDRTIRLPDFDKTRSRPSDQFALTSVGIEENGFGGSVNGFRYQFEGEEDLLHLIVTRENGEPLTAEDGQRVAGFVLPGVPPALIWLKPGTYSQHFFVGHDELPV